MGYLVEMLWTMRQAREMFFVLNEISRHEDVWWSGGIALRIHKFGTAMR
jgi:hypothetical protein